MRYTRFMSQSCIACPPSLSGVSRASVPSVPSPRVRTRPPLPLWQRRSSQPGHGHFGFGNGSTFDTDMRYSIYCHVGSIYNSNNNIIYRVSHNTVSTLFLSFSRVLEPVQRNFWPLFNSPWNLLHNSHKNFENWFRNSLDNWHQSWHPSFWNWHFAITQSQKKTIWCYRCQLWPQLSQLFLNQFSKFLWLSCSKFPGLLKNGQKDLCMCSRSRENGKKKVGTIIWDTL